MENISIVALNNKWDINLKNEIVLNNLYLFLLFYLYNYMYLFVLYWQIWSSIPVTKFYNDVANFLLLLTKTKTFKLVNE